MRLTLPMGLYINTPNNATSSPQVTTYALWTFTLAEPTELAITVTTVDESDVVIAWGDGTSTVATSGVEAAKEVAAGENLILRVSNASNIIAVDISGNTGVGGVLILGSCTQLLGVDADGSGLDSIDVGEWPSTICEVSVNTCNLDAGGIDLLLEALNNSNVEGGSLNYGINPGSADESRSPEGAMAKAALAGKGWLIVS